MILRPPRSTLFPTRRSSDLPTADLDMGAPEKYLAEHVSQNIGKLKEPFMAVVQLSNVHYPYYLDRSEEHTSELQSQSNLVCRLLLEKKNKQKLTLSI